MINTLNKNELKTTSWSVARKWVIADDCEGSVSVNIEHNGETVSITGCDYDGSAYLLTSEEIGLIGKDIVLFRCMFVDMTTVMIIVDQGSVAFRKGDSVYSVKDNGVVKKLDEDEVKTIRWYKAERDLQDAIQYFVTRDSKRDYHTVAQYIFNFLFTFSMKREGDCSTLKYYGLNDEMTRNLEEPYKFYYLPVSAIEFDDDSDDEVEIDEEEYYDFMGDEEEDEEREARVMFEDDEDEDGEEPEEDTSEEDFDYDDDDEEMFEVVEDDYD